MVLLGSYRALFMVTIAFKTLALLATWLFVKEPRFTPAPQRAL